MQTFRKIEIARTKNDISRKIERYLWEILKKTTTKTCCCFYCNNCTKTIYYCTPTQTLILQVLQKILGNLMPHIKQPHAKLNCFIKKFLIFYKFYKKTTTKTVVVFILF